MYTTGAVSCTIRIGARCLGSGIRVFSGFLGCHTSNRVRTECCCKMMRPPAQAQARVARLHGLIATISDLPLPFHETQDSKSEPLLS